LKERNALPIYDILRMYLKSKGIFDKIISLCTDGAAVMCSKKMERQDFLKKILK
jgi:hypothetical protein